MYVHILYATIWYSAQIIHIQFEVRNPVSVHSYYTVSVLYYRYHTTPVIQNGGGTFQHCCRPCVSISCLQSIFVGISVVLLRWPTRCDFSRFTCPKRLAHCVSLTQCGHLLRVFYSTRIQSTGRLLDRI